MFRSIITKLYSDFLKKFLEVIDVSVFLANCYSIFLLSLEPPLLLIVLLVNLLYTKPERLFQKVIEHLGTSLSSLFDRHSLDFFNEWFLLFFAIEIIHTSLEVYLIDFFLLHISFLIASLTSLNDFFLWWGFFFILSLRLEALLKRFFFAVFIFFRYFLLRFPYGYYFFFLTFIYIFRLLLLRFFLL